MIRSTRFIARAAKAGSATATATATGGVAKRAASSVPRQTYDRRTWAVAALVGVSVRLLFEIYLRSAS